MREGYQRYRRTPMQKGKSEIPKALTGELFVDANVFPGLLYTAKG